MANLRNRLGRYFQDKLGITELRHKAEQELSFQMSFLNLASADVWHLDTGMLKAIEEDLEERYGIKSFSAAIHKNDLMFQHHLYHHPDIGEALLHYFRVGASVSSELGKLFALPAQARLLDFGAGYGRLTRFLPSVFRDTDITASEVKPPAIEFLRKSFGIKGVLHGTDADTFPVSEYHGILALSVFTHLPQGKFDAWFKTLSGSLSGGGRLIFTWNNIARLRDQQAKQFYYTAQSEDSFFITSDRLASDDDYGLTYVSGDYIKKLADNAGLKLELMDPDFTGSQQLAIVSKL